MFRNQIVKIETGDFAGMFGKVLDAKGTDVRVQILGINAWQVYPIRSLTNTARLSVKEVNERTHICQFVAQTENEAEVNSIVAKDADRTRRHEYHTERIKDELNRVLFLVWAIGPHNREAINA